MSGGGLRRNSICSRLYPRGLGLLLGTLGYGCRGQAQWPSTQGPALPRLGTWSRSRLQRLQVCVCVCDDNPDRTDKQLGRPASRCFETTGIGTAYKAHHARSHSFGRPSFPHAPLSPILNGSCCRSGGVRWLCPRTFSSGGLQAGGPLLPTPPALWGSEGCPVAFVSLCVLLGLVGIAVRVRLQGLPSTEAPLCAVVPGCVGWLVRCMPPSV